MYRMGVGSDRPGGLVARGHIFFDERYEILSEITHFPGGFSLCLGGVLAMGFCMFLGWVSFFLFLSFFL